MGEKTEKRSKLNGNMKMIEKLEAAAPYNIFFTKLPETDETLEPRNCLSFSDLVCPSLGELTCSLQINCKINIKWLKKQYQVHNQHEKPLTILYGCPNECMNKYTHQMKNVKHYLVNREEGSHNSKVGIYAYKNGEIRIVVSTANLNYEDWNKYNQVLWVSPPCPRMDDSMEDIRCAGPTGFKTALVKYLKSYNTRILTEWIHLVTRADFSNVKVCLITSIPGTHYPRSTATGCHLHQMGTLLSNYCSLPFKTTSESEGPLDWKIIAQASNLGSFGETPGGWLRRFLLRSLASHKQERLPNRSSAFLCIIYPTADNVMNSQFAAEGGRCLSYSKEVDDQQKWLRDYLYQWKSDKLGRSETMPLSKTYCRISSCHKKLAWFLLTSSNITKSAWGGNIQLKGQGCDVRSYEVGVLFLPSFFEEEYFTISSDSEDAKLFPIMYDLPLTRYSKDDEPWCLLHSSKTGLNGKLNTNASSSNESLVNILTSETTSKPNLETLGEQGDKTGSEIICKPNPLENLGEQGDKMNVNIGSKPNSLENLGVEGDKTNVNTASEIISKPNPSENLEEGDMKMMDKLEASTPYNIFFTKVPEAVQTLEPSNCISFPDLICPSLGELKCSLQINFMIDIEWLYEQYKFNNQHKKPLTILYGFEFPNMKEYMKQLKNVKHYLVKMKDSFGTHHSKIGLYAYENGDIRVVVSTANLYYEDWNCYNQGLWVSPPCPKMPHDKQDSECLGPTGFKTELLKYLYSYNAPILLKWINLVERADFSNVKVCLITSIPGTHGPKDTGCHLQHIGDLLSTHCTLPSKTENDGPLAWSIIAQASSLGSLGKTPEKWLRKYLLRSLASHKQEPLPGTSKAVLSIVYPSVDNVMNSHFGAEGGGCLPYSKINNDKQKWLQDYLNQWKADSLGRTSAMPHMKSYCRVSACHTKLAWFLLTSSNISRSAWGSNMKKDKSCYIRSYEAGVLFLPSFFDEDYFTISSESNEGKLFPFMYDLPLSSYSKDDEPWCN